MDPAVKRFELLAGENVRQVVKMWTAKLATVRQLSLSRFDVDDHAPALLTEAMDEWKKHWLEVAPVFQGTEDEYAAVVVGRLRKGIWGKILSRGTN